MRLSTGLLISTDSSVTDSKDEPTTRFAKTLKKTLSDAFQTADSFLKGARKRQKTGYDKWARDTIIPLVNASGYLIPQCVVAEPIN